MQYSLNRHRSSCWPWANLSNQQEFYLKLKILSEFNIGHFLNRRVYIYRFPKTIKSLKGNY